KIFIAVGNDDVIAHHGYSGVYASFGDDNAPDFFAGLRLHGVHASVADTADEQALAADGRDHRRGIRRVIRTPAGSRDPKDFAGPLIHRDETLGPVSHAAPRRDGRADDHQIAVDQGCHGSAAVGGERAEFLAYRAIP